MHLKVHLELSLSKNHDQQNIYCPPNKCLKLFTYLMSNMFIQQGVALVGGANVACTHSYSCKNVTLTLLLLCIVYPF